MKNQIALSIDVEDWYHTPAISGSSFAKFKSLGDFFKNWSGRYDYLTDSALETLDLLKQHQIRATFFIVADTVERYPQIVEALQKSNHEIGCHGLHHVSAIDPKTKQPFQSKDEWVEDVSTAKKILEDTFQRKVTGFRAPNAYFGNWMVDELIKLGFEYDSSIAYNMMYNKTNVKLAKIPTTPYFMSSVTLSPTDRKTIVELPWSQFNFLGMPLPAGGAFFYRVLGNTYFKMALHQNLNHGDTMFYFHPLDLTREEFPMTSGKHRPMYWINKGQTTAKRLNKLLAHFKGRWTSCENVAKRFLEQNHVR